MPFSEARWIWSDIDHYSDYTVCRFRGKFTVGAEQRIKIDVSADSRYLLYLDGKRLGRGPARSDLRHYVYETYEPHVGPGEHVLAAMVVHYAQDGSPVAEMHDRAAFVLQATDAKGSVLTATGQESSPWRTSLDASVTTNVTKLPIETYIAIGKTEDVDGSLVPQNWELPEFDDTSWTIGQGHLSPVMYAQSTDLGDGRWRLMPRDIAMPFEERRAFQTETTFPLTVAPNTTQTIILNAGEYAIGYPELQLNGGRGSSVEMHYAEAMSRDGSKGLRDATTGNDVEGFHDTYRPGGAAEKYTPFALRAFRFVKLVVTTAAEPLELNKVSYLLTGYPWQRVSEFKAQPTPQDLDTIQDVDFRTLQRCTYETFMDCPYYEQLQYVGDTRLQALLGYVTTGDTDLAARAVRLFDWSRIPEGLTQSRYPSRVEQIIPPFSLFWVMMVEDLWRYAPDESQTVADALTGCRGVLEWFGKHLNPDGVLSGHMPWWHFVDWSKEWLPTLGVPAPAAAGVPCATINLQYLAALQAYVRLHEGLGDTRESEFWQAEADMLADAITVNFWNSNKKLFQEGPDESYGFSQHAQAWAILTGLVPADALDSLVDSLHTDETLVQATYYHTFYIVEALAKTQRLEQLWTKWLKPWRDALGLRVSTWPEQPEPTRSDCHAWSAWPSYALLTHVLGAKPGEPGTGDFEITPQRVAGWSDVSGSVATPNGVLRVSVNWPQSGPAKIEASLEDGGRD